MPIQTRRLFTIVWRINAIIILCVGVLAGAVLSFVAYKLYGEATQARHVHAVANTSSKEIEKENLEIGTFEEIPGAAVLRAPLHVRQTYPLGSHAKEAASIRNYLYFDTSSRTTRWLRPSMDGIILETRTLPQVEYGQKQPDAVTALFVLVEQDSNGDSRLTHADKKRIAVSDPKGNGYRVVVENADQFLKAQLLAPDRLLILYSSDSKLLAIELNPKQLGTAAKAYEVQKLYK